MRIPDQYPEIGFALASGVALGIKDLWILVWAFSLVLVIVPGYMLNELVDSADTDRNSWNPVHADTTKISKTTAKFIMISLFVTGLFIAATIGMFTWALATGTIVIAYSLKPFRLKNIPALDVISQPAFAFAIPFLAPFAKQSMITGDILIFILIMFIAVWSVTLPYQLSDYSADKKANLRGTHVIMGIRKSLISGLILGILGLVSYVALGFYTTHPWSIVFFLFVLLVVLFYFYWIRLESVKEQERAMRRYVEQFKPISQLLLPYIILLYFLV